MYHWLDITLRLSIAMCFGAAIGLERESRDKAAGLRTHMLVSLGAAMFVLVPILVSQNGPNPEALSRVVQGVATGVGFLGAGEIIHESQPKIGKFKIRGLTSAAAIWISAALGVTAGCGLWQLGLIAALLGLSTLIIIKQFERPEDSSS